MTPRDRSSSKDCIKTKAHLLCLKGIRWRKINFTAKSKTDCELHRWSFLQLWVCSLAADYTVNATLEGYKTISFVITLPPECDTWQGNSFKIIEACLIQKAAMPSPEVKRPRLRLFDSAYKVRIRGIVQGGWTILIGKTLPNSMGWLSVGSCFPSETKRGTCSWRSTSIRRGPQR